MQCKNDFAKLVFKLVHFTIFLIMSIKPLIYIDSSSPHDEPVQYREGCQYLVPHAKIYLLTLPSLMPSPSK